MSRPMATHRPKARPGARPGNGPGPRPKTAVRRTLQKKKEPEPFLVLIAVNRPRYRVRAERAMNGDGWGVRSLLNKEDPIGLINQKQPDVLIISDDFGRNKTLGFVKAAQKWRATGLKLILLTENAEVATAATEFYDSCLVTPWKTIQLRNLVAAIFEANRGAKPEMAEIEEED